MLDSLLTNYAPDGMAVDGLAQLDRSPSLTEPPGAWKQSGRTNLSAQALLPNWVFQPERISGWCAGG